MASENAREENNTLAAAFTRAIDLDDRTPKQEHLIQFLPRGPFRAYIHGSSGSGKSYLLRLIIPNLCPQTKWVMICTQIPTNQVHDAIEAYCQQKGLAFAKENTVDGALQAMNEFRSEKAREDHGVIIFDDFMSIVSAGVRDEYTDFVAQCISFLRNDNISCIVISQHTVQLPPRARASCNVRFIYRAETRQSLDNCSRDCSGVFVGKPITFEDVYQRFVQRAKFNYLCIHMGSPTLWAVTFCDRDPASGGVVHKIDVDSGNIVSRETIGNPSAGTIETVARGEIGAGNRSPYTRLTAVAAEAAVARGRKRTALLRQFVELANEPKISLFIAQKIAHSAGIDEDLELT